MLVLGIESASDQCGCALATEAGVIAEARLALPRRHAEALAPQMKFVCEQAGVALRDVEAVAVDCGPGLYTGLRAGLATAKATAAALGIGVVPVGSLEALALGAVLDARPGKTVLSVLDARRGEVFWAWYRLAPGSGGEAPSAAADTADRSGTRIAAGHGDVDVDSRGLAGSAAALGRLVQLSAPQVGPPVDLLAGLASPGDRASGRTVVVGDGALRYANLLAGLASPGDRASGRTVVVGDGALRYANLLALSHVVIAGPELRFPSPGAVALLGRERAVAGQTLPPAQVEALYLRSPDAQPQAQR